MRHRKRLWNRSAIFMLCVLAAAACAGCGAREEAPAETAERAEDTELETEPFTEEETESAPEEITVELGEDVEERYTDDSGVILLTGKVNSVAVSLPGNREAEDAINAFFENAAASYADTVREYRDMAAEELAWRAEEGIDAASWSGYGLGRTYSVMRADERMISILEEGYEDTGGAHPNSASVAYNFDTGTGERLALSDVTDDMDDMRDRCLAFLKEALSEEAREGLLFEDYENDLADILTDATWYTADDGFHIICNEYIVSPHAAGIRDFVMPYEETALLDRYLPAEAESGRAEQNGRTDQTEQSASQAFMDGRAE